MNNTGRDHLEALSKSKYNMAKGQPNLENWKIVDHTGEKVGTVHDLLIDKEAKKVRYIIANLKNGELLQQDRLVLMPVGRAHYRESEHQVVFSNVTRDQLSSLPDFVTVDRLTQEDEYAVRNAYRSEGESATSTGDQDGGSFYDHEDFNEERIYNRRGTTRTGDRKEKEDKNEPLSTPGKGKTVGDNDTRSRGIGDQQTSSESNKKNEDVNVHPDRAERPGDGFGSDNLGESETDIINANRSNRGRANGDNDRT